MSDDEIEREALRWITRRDAGFRPGEEDAFERWRRADPRHQRALEVQLSVFQLFEQPAASTKPRTAEDTAEQRSQRRRRQRLTFAAGLAAVVTGLIFFIAYQAKSRMPRSGKTTQGRAILIAPVRKTLDDGSRIDLRPDTEISVNFNRAERRVGLKSGGAFFQVTGQPDWPFIVETGAVEILAMGTAFSVQIGAERTEILVAEGRVRIAAPRPTPSGEGSHAPSLSAGGSTHLEAGNVATFVTRVASHGEPASVPAVMPVGARDMEARLQWRTPRVECDRAPLEDVVAVMNRASPAQIMLAEPALSRLEISGFYRADNIDAFLAALKSSHGITAVRTADRVTLERAR